MKTYSVIYSFMSHVARKRVAGHATVEAENEADAKERTEQLLQGFDDLHVLEVTQVPTA